MRGNVFTESTNHAIGTTTMAGAIDRVVDAAQHVVADEVGLVRLEVKTLLAEGLRGGAFVTLGGIFLLLAWGAILVGAYVSLTALTPFQRLGLIVAVNAILGIALVAIGNQRLSTLDLSGGLHGSR